jgi:hypothetical protein
MGALKGKGCYFAKTAYASGLQEGLKYYIDKGIFKLGAYGVKHA